MIALCLLILVIVGCGPLGARALSELVHMWDSAPYHGTTTPLEAQAWADGLDTDLEWEATIAADHAILDSIDRAVAHHEAVALDVAWTRTIEAAHVALEVLYCTMHAGAVAPRLRYAESRPCDGVVAAYAMTGPPT